jgi:hypothetical protein
VLFSLFYLFFGVFDMIVSTGLLALAIMADAATAAATTAAPVDPMEKVICRRFTETGSLAKTKRVCLTKREWVAADEKGRKFAEEVVRDGNKGATFQ